MTSYDANNRQLSFGDKTLTYDDNGNLQSITDSNGTTLYSWNARNQLVGINGPIVNATFVYDGAGRRQKKTINGSVTEFLYDGLNVVQETSGAAILANILAGLAIDEILTRADVLSGVTSIQLPDALGSSIAITAEAGTVQTEYTFDPFGSTTAFGLSNTNAFQYTNRENDGTGLQYNRARYYNPSLQRFISEDPAGFVDGTNLFIYADLSPLLFSDPEGLFSTGDAVFHYFMGGGRAITLDFSEVDIGLQPKDFQGYTAAVQSMYKKVGVRYVDLRRSVDIGKWAGHQTYRLKGTITSDTCKWDFDGYVGAYNNSFDFNSMPWGVRAYWKEIVTRAIGAVNAGSNYDIAFYGHRTVKDSGRW